MAYGLSEVLYRGRLFFPPPSPCDTLRTLGTPREMQG